MINRHLVHLWRQMKIHRILTLICLYQIGCLYYFCYAKTSSPAVQKRHSKVYGNPIPPPPCIRFSLPEWGLTLICISLTLICISLTRKCMLSANWCATMSKDGHVRLFSYCSFFQSFHKKLILFDLKIIIYFPSISLVF